MYLCLFNLYPFDIADLQGDNDLIEILANSIEFASSDKPVSEDAIDFLMHLLDPNPMTRFSAEDALTHQWFENVWENETKAAVGDIQSSLSYNDQNEIEGYSPDNF